MQRGWELGSWDPHTKFPGDWDLLVRDIPAATLIQELSGCAWLYRRHMPPALEINLEDPIGSLKKYLLSIGYMAGNILGTEKIGKWSFRSHGAYIPIG